MQVSLDNFNRVKQQNYFSNRSNVSFRGDIDDIIVVDDPMGEVSASAKNITTVTDNQSKKNVVKASVTKTTISSSAAKKAATVKLPDKVTDIKAPVDVQDTRSLNYFSKNPNQIMSIAPEHKGLGLKAYNKGGLAVVAMEAPMSWVDKLGADVRSVLAYHSRSPQGNIMIVRLPKEEAIKYRTDHKLPGLVQEAWIHEVPVDYKPSKNEFFAVIDSVQKEKDKKKIGFPYIKLENTGIKGEIEAIEEGYFKTQKIKYHLFKASTTNAEKKYFMHIPQVAAMSAAYGNNGAYHSGQIIGNWDNLYYSNFCRAVSDAMPQMAKKEGFNPASIWMHDRPMFPLQADIARRSCNGEAFYQGFKMHSTLHNPGYAYQGYMEDISSFIKIVYHSDDFKALSSRPDFEIIKDIISKPEKMRTIDDNRRLLTVFGDFCENLCDEYRRPNITMLSIANRLANPDNSTVGTVSKYYGEEMKRLNDIAQGLRSKLASIDTLDITNGSLPASLGLDVRKSFGLGGNALTDNNSGYTPYSPYVDDNGNVLNYEKPSKKIIDSAKIKRDANLKELKELESKICTERKIYDDVVAKLENSKIDSDKKNELETLKQIKQSLLTELEEKQLLFTRNETNYKHLLDLKSVKDAKLDNKKWVLDLISSCVDKDKKPDVSKLKSLFYNGDQIKSGLLVHGYLSSYKDGDRLFTNWGRSDEQKGFATFLRGFYNYIKSKAPEGLSNDAVKKFEENKKHVKLLFGSAGKWPKDSVDYKNILKYMQLIKDAGYGDNVLYVEGFFPNNLVGACDFGLFTSRFEPCGITPLETYSAGCPVASIRTGGAPNFVFDKKDGFEKATGFLTDDSYLIEGDRLKKLTGFDADARKKELFGDLKEIKLLDKRDLSKEDVAKLKEVPKELMDKYRQELDEKRAEALSKQVATLFERCMGLSEAEYDELAKNACAQKIEWHSNSMYNLDASGKGKSANDLYFEKAFGINVNKVEKGGTREFLESNPRSIKPMQKLTGEFGDTSKLALETVEDAVETSILNTTKRTSDVVTNGSSFIKRLIHDRRAYYVAASVAAVAGIAAYAINRNNSEKSVAKPVIIGSSKVYF